MNGIFVTGTDTDCGKTVVATTLARAALEKGFRVRVLKPVETGCRLEGDEPVPLDGRALARAARDPRPLPEICPYRLRLPAAPQVAAEAEGIRIDVGRILKAAELGGAEGDLLIVEGAGGLLVPLCPGVCMADLAGRLDLPLLVVARAKLGTLNHTRLTLEAASTRNLNVAGLVVSHTERELPASDRANLDLLLRELTVPFLGEIPHGPAPHGLPKGLRDLLGSSLCRERPILVPDV
ncbi:MAG: dethiobiotin synthase [Myxococcota bacterium]